MSSITFLFDDSANNQGVGTSKRRRSVAHPGTIAKVQGDVGGKDEVKKGMFRAYSLSDMSPLISFDAADIPI